MNSLQPIHNTPDSPKTMPFITIKRGQGFWTLSEREKLICDVFLRFRSFAECHRSLMAKYGKSPSVNTIKGWMRRSHVREYIEEQLLNSAEASMTKDEYIAKIRRIAEGDRQVNKTTPFFWKLLGEAKGFLVKEESGLQNNIQINFVQANGKP